MRTPQAPQSAGTPPQPLAPELAALRVEFDAGRLTEREYLSRRAALLRGDAGRRTL